MVFKDWIKQKIEESNEGWKTHLRYPGARYTYINIAQRFTEDNAWRNYWHQKFVGMKVGPYTLGGIATGTFASLSKLEKFMYMSKEKTHLILKIVVWEGR